MFCRRPPVIAIINFPEKKVVNFTARYAVHATVSVHKKRSSNGSSHEMVSVGFTRSSDMKLNESCVMVSGCNATCWRPRKPTIGFDILRFSAEPTSLEVAAIRLAQGTQQITENTSQKFAAFQPLCLCPSCSCSYDFFSLVNSPLSPSITPSLCFTPASRPTSFTNLSRHRLPSSLRLTPRTSRPDRFF